MAKRGRIYHNFYSSELWERVNPENKAILEDFLAEYKQRKMSTGTISGYRNDLRIVFIYILQYLDNRSILVLNKKDFRGLSLYLTETCEMSPARTNRIKSAVNSLLTFCEEDDDYNYDVNYAKKVKGIPNERVKDNDDNFFFTFDEFIRVRDILLERNELQTAVLWSLGFDSAGRRNELFQVQKYGLLEGNKTNVVIGKRGKKFPLVYLDDTRDIIGRYLDWRGEDDIDSLWIHNNLGFKQPVGNSIVLYERVANLSSILSEIRGVQCAIFPHTMRHSRLECLSQGTDTRLLDINGKPRKYSLEEIQTFAHHSSVSITQSYLKDHSEDTIDAMFGF